MKTERELELESELELSQLQICQLQEELEHFYLECNRLKQQKAVPGIDISSTPAHVLLRESRNVDAGYIESGFYEKSKSLQAKVLELSKVLEETRTEKNELNLQLDKLESALTASRRDLETSSQAQDRLEAEKAALTRQISELESALTASRRDLETSSQEKDILESENVTLAQRIGDLEESLMDTSGALDFTEAEKLTLQRQVEDMESDRDKEARLHLENKKRAENLQQEIAQLQEELKESSRGIALGQKMLVKSQIDLEHLRKSYAEKVASEKGLVELVGELREKLTLASRYYYDLQKEHPEILISIDDPQSS